MPTLFKRKGTRFIWCRGRDVDGTPWRESTHQTDRGAAGIAARAIERRRLLGTDQPENATTIAGALKLLEEDDATAGRPPGTIEYHSTKGRHVSRLLGAALQLSKIDGPALKAYATSRIEEGAHRHTVAKEITVLRKAARLAGVPIPAKLVPDLGRFYTPRDRWLPVDEYRKLLFTLPLNRRHWLIGFCHTGLRDKELRALEAPHVDFARRVLEVPGTKTEKSAREVPLSDDAMHMLEKLVAATPAGEKLFRGITKKCFRDLMKRACKRAGIALVTPNDMRRTFCSWLANAGVSEGRAARYMGSSSTMVRRVYAQFAASTMAGDAELLPKITSAAKRRM